MFLHLSDSVHGGGGCLSQHAPQVTWPGGLYPGAVRETSPPCGNERAVRTLLECILVESRYAAYDKLKNTVSKSIKCHSKNVMKICCFFFSAIWQEREKGGRNQDSYHVVFIWDLSESGDFIGRILRAPSVAFYWFSIFVLLLIGRRRRKEVSALISFNLLISYSE